MKCFWFNNSIKNYELVEPEDIQTLVFEGCNKNKNRGSGGLRNPQRFHSYWTYKFLSDWTPPQDPNCHIFCHSISPWGLLWLVIFLKLGADWDLNNGINVIWCFTMTDINMIIKKKIIKIIHVLENFMKLNIHAPMIYLNSWWSLVLLKLPQELFKSFF